MLEGLQSLLELITPYISYALPIGFVIYIIYKSGFWKQANKMANETTSTKIFIKLYAALVFQLFKGLQMFLLEYAIYMALYGFILFNVYNLLGFEITVIIALVLILTRIQLKFGRR